MPDVVECFSVEEFDEINRALGWQTEYRQLKPGGFRAQFCAVGNSEGLLTREVFTGCLEVHAEEPAETVSVLIPTDRCGEIRFNNHQINDGELLILSPGAELQAHCTSGVVVYAMRLPLTEYEALMAAMTYDSPDHSLSRGRVVAIEVGSEALTRFRGTAGRLMSSNDPSSQLGSEDIADLLRRVLESVVGSGVGREKRRPTARQMVLRRAVDFIESSLHDVIRVTDLCRSTHVCVRTLERLFMQEFGVSPSEYILARRLNVVRRQLVAASPEMTTVAKIASGHGFNHLGRFAGTYRQFFGEPPQETLVRSR